MGKAVWEMCRDMKNCPIKVMYEKRVDGLFVLQ